MAPASLSEIELYYTPKENISAAELRISGEEFHHIKNVMRHKTGDSLYVTDGEGAFYKTVVSEISQSEIVCSISDKDFFENKLANFYFCIPRLKSSDRFEFALEKCVELGITNFIVFDAERSIAKGSKIDRWQKVLNSAMKQSLTCWLPSVFYLKNLNELKKWDGKKIFFEQRAEQSLQSFLKDNIPFYSREKYYFIFGPEGGLTGKEFELFEDSEILKLTDNRLRAETAILTAASITALSI